MLLDFISVTRHVWSPPTKKPGDIGAERRYETDGGENNASRGGTKVDTSAVTELCFQPLPVRPARTTLSAALRASFETIFELPTCRFD